MTTDRHCSQCWRLGGWEAGIRVKAGQLLDGGPLPRFQKARFSLHLHWWREVIGPKSLLLGTLIPLTLSLGPNDPPKVLPSNIIPLGMRAVAYELKGRDPAIHAHSPQSRARGNDGISVSHRNFHIHLRCASIINDQKCIS